MDLQLWMNRIIQDIVDWWQTLGDEHRLHIWLSAGLVGLAVWVGLAYLIVRRLSGHRKFLGRWYNETEYERLMQVLWQDQLAGTRVMSRTELQALRSYRYGNSLKPILDSKGGGYFDV